MENYFCTTFLQSEMKMHKILKFFSAVEWYGLDATKLKCSNHEHVTASSAHKQIKTVFIFVFFSFHFPKSKPWVLFIQSRKKERKKSKVSSCECHRESVFCVCYTVLEMTFSAKFEVGFFCLYNIISLLILFISSRKSFSLWNLNHFFFSSSSFFFSLPRFGGSQNFTWYLQYILEINKKYKSFSCIKFYTSLNRLDNDFKNCRGWRRWWWWCCKMCCVIFYVNQSSCHVGW